MSGLEIRGLPSGGSVELPEDMQRDLLLFPAVRWQLPAKVGTPIKLLPAASVAGARLGASSPSGRP